MRALSDAEVQVRSERVGALHTSGWVIDTVTAVLIDSGCGGAGLMEDAARVKAARILGHLGLDVLARTNNKWTEDGYALAAKARGVLASGDELHRQRAASPEPSSATPSA